MRAHVPVTNLSGRATLSGEDCVTEIGPGLDWVVHCSALILLRGKRIVLLTKHRHFSVLINSNSHDLRIVILSTLSFET